MERIVAIHQPNFFPWLGYFSKMLRSDTFIFMDNVQFPKKQGNWGNRVCLIVGGHKEYVTMPVVRSFHGTRLIVDIQIDGTLWKKKLLNTIRANYAHAAFFQQVYPLLEGLINNQNSNLAVYNRHTIRGISTLLGVDNAKFVVGSDLDGKGTATDLLISMTRAVGGTGYLCGDGAADYFEGGKFEEAGIGVTYQHFQHPIYPQVNTKDFVSGLSIIDSLLNCGIEGTRKLLL